MILLYIVKKRKLSTMNLTRKNISFKATIVNQYEINRCLSNLKQHSYTPSCFIADYSNNLEKLHNNDLIAFMRDSEAKKNRICEVLYKKLLTKINEIKNWGSKDDMIQIGATKGKSAAVEFSNPAMDNNVFSPSRKYFQVTPNIPYTKCDDNFVDSALSLDTKILDDLKSKHLKRTDEFKSKYGNPRSYPEYLWQIDGDDLV